MEDLNSSFWIGLTAAIPLSIAANLLAPKIQQLLSKRSDAKTTKRIAEIRTEYERVLGFTKNPDALHTHLLQSILFITFFAAFFGAISGALFALGSFVPNSSRFFQLGQVVAVLGAVGIARICIDAIRDTNRVRQFDRYKTRVESEIGKIE